MRRSDMKKIRLKKSPITVDKNQGATQSHITAKRYPKMCDLITQK